MIRDFEILTHDGPDVELALVAPYAPNQAVKLDHVLTPSLALRLGAALVTDAMKRLAAAEARVGASVEAQVGAMRDQDRDRISRLRVADITPGAPDDFPRAG